MTPDEEALFIELWQQGLTLEAMAQQLDWRLGTVKSRLHTLLRQGKIQRREGRRTPALATAKEAPAPPAPQVPPAPPAPATPAMTFVAVPEIQEILSIVKDLQARVGELEQSRVPPVLPVPPAAPAVHAPPTLPAPPAPERKDIQQWTVRLSKALVDHVKAVAYEQRKNPSEVVEECLWRALGEERAKS